MLVSLTKSSFLMINVWVISSPFTLMVYTYSTYDIVIYSLVLINFWINIEYTTVMLNGVMNR